MGITRGCACGVHRVFQGMHGTSIRSAWSVHMAEGLKKILVTNAGFWGQGLFQVKIFLTRFVPC